MEKSVSGASGPDRPLFPKRAVVTAGMPYGNKDLHFGHIGGVFVPADMYARFLRNRIGADNVLFVSGTDCYGSPIIEGHRKAVEDKGFTGTISDYVMRNHESQKRTLDDYLISLNIFEGSGLGCAAEPHKRMTDYFFHTLYDNGYLELMSTAQFYDPQAEMFLNGRQVVGRCPVQGCKSEKGYADECDLGHQYNPEELIAPKSTITGTVPELRPVANWYFKLPEFGDIIRKHVENLRAEGKTRPFALSSIEEFLEPPIIYIQEKFHDEFEAVRTDLPAHEVHPAEEGKSSFTVEFEDIASRDIARGVLMGGGVRFRTGKTLVPFRLTGNIDWGVAAPELEGKSGLTVWCWPESLWAPISFTSAALGFAGLDPEDWRDWWCSEDAEIYQFIGEDNIYFYGVAQTGLFSAMQSEHGRGPEGEDSGGELKQTQLIANHHLLFLNKKASSSGQVKPPMASELLEHYNPEQLRAHFLALGLGMKSVSFQPKPFDPTANEKSPDPALKESALLTNIFNRLARSCFYTAQKVTGNRIPIHEPSDGVVNAARETILEYERLMSRYELHMVVSLMDGYLRECNRYWSEHYKKTDDPAELEEQKHILADAFYMLRVATILMEPVAPAGTRKIIEYLDLDCTDEKFLSWEHIFDGYAPFVSDEEISRGGHLLRELPPRTDFFERHPSQFA